MGTLDVYTESQILVRTENRRPQNVSNFTWRVLKEQMATSARSGVVLALPTLRHVM